MKYFSIPVIMLMAVLAACEKKAEQTVDGMSAFHTVMAESWHPVGDSGNFEPAKRLAADLEQRARDWSAAVGADAETSAALNVLIDSCASFRKAVEIGKPDSLLRPTLAEIHHIFHKLHEKAESHEGSGHH